MHTDEYEISLSRELGVCEGHVRKYQRLLQRLEARHGMTIDEYLHCYRTGTLPSPEGVSEWQRTIEALQHWSRVRDEYRRLLGAMKISAP